MYQRMDPAYTTAHLTSYIWRIPDIKAKLEFMKTGQDQDISCKPLFIKELGITMNAALFVIDPYKHLSMYMGFAKSDEADTSNMTAYYHRRTVVILDQTENRERKDIIRIFEPGFGPKDAEEWMKEYLPNELAPISLLERDDTYIKNDILLIEIIVEPMFPLYRNFFSSNGMLHWVIDNYSYKKRLEKDNIVTCQRSDYFYNNPIGYRMQAELYLNGLGNLNIEKSLSINVIVKNGKWDSFIPNSYPRKITFIVFDQSDSEAKKHFTKVVTNPSGTFFNTAADLIPFEEIESPNSIYLKNDALCIDVLVERLEKGDGK